MSASHNVLQEYFGLMNDAVTSGDTHTRDVRLLRAWGVYKSTLSGSTNCEQCEAPVRLAIPIESQRLDGETLHYSCLCTHCTFQELKMAHSITMQVGDASVQYPHEDRLI